MRRLGLVFRQGLPSQLKVSAIDAVVVLGRVHARSMQPCSSAFRPSGAQRGLFPVRRDNNTALTNHQARSKAIAQTGRHQRPVEKMQHSPASVTRLKQFRYGSAGWPTTFLNSSICSALATSTCCCPRWHMMSLLCTTRTSVSLHCQRAKAPPCCAIKSWH